jgi:hypothetical protein
MSRFGFMEYDEWKCELPRMSPRDLVGYVVKEAEEDAADIGAIAEAVRELAAEELATFKRIAGEKQDARYHETCYPPLFLPIYRNFQCTAADIVTSTGKLAKSASSHFDNAALRLKLADASSETGIIAAHWKQIGQECYSVARYKYYADKSFLEAQRYLESVKEQVAEYIAEQELKAAQKKVTHAQDSMAS